MFALSCACVGVDRPEGNDDEDDLGRITVRTRTMDCMVRTNVVAMDVFYFRFVDAGMVGDVYRNVALESHAGYGPEAKRGSTPFPPDIVNKHESSDACERRSNNFRRWKRILAGLNVCSRGATTGTIDDTRWSTVGTGGVGVGTARSLTSARS